MKKFGTPIGAAPGVAIDRVGLSGVGVPSAWRPGATTFLAARWRALRTCLRILALAVSVFAPPRLAGFPFPGAWGSVVCPPPVIGLAGVLPPPPPPPPPVPGTGDPVGFGTDGTVGVA